MKQINLKHIETILLQYEGPIKLTYQTKAISNITYELACFHKNNVHNIENYGISDLFSLFHIIEYALKDLGEDEFSTVTGLNLYEEGYPLLGNIHRSIKNFGK